MPKLIILYQKLPHAVRSSALSVSVSTVIFAFYLLLNTFLAYGRIDKSSSISENILNFIDLLIFGGALSIIYWILITGILALIIGFLNTGNESIARRLFNTFISTILSITITFTGGVVLGVVIAVLSFISRSLIIR